MRIKKQQINDFIEERYRERGRQYYEEGLVDIERIETAKISAKCVGTHIYSVTLSSKKGRLYGECTCPAYEDYGPCKHLAAVAYAAISHQKDTYSPNSACLERLAEHQRLKDHLNGLSKSDLISLIMRLVGQDDELLWMLVGDEDEYE